MGVPPEQLNDLAKAASDGQDGLVAREDASATGRAADRATLPQGARPGPSPDDLASVREVMRYLGLTVTPDTDLLQMLVTSASRFFLEEVSKPIKPGARKVVANGGRSTVVLPLTPVISVESVTANGQTVPPATEGETDSGWLWSEGTSVIVFRDYRTPRGVGNIVVRYTSGYAEVPGDVRGAVVALAAARYQERKFIGVQSRSIGGETVTFVREDMTPEIKRVVERMKRVAP